jgi:hypothetical protein
MGGRRSGATPRIDGRSNGVDGHRDFGAADGRLFGHSK